MPRGLGQTRARYQLAAWAKNRESDNCESDTTGSANTSPVSPYHLPVGGNLRYALVVACASRFGDRGSVLVQWCSWAGISRLAPIKVAFRASFYIDAHLLLISQISEAKAWSDQATRVGWAIITSQMGDLRVDAGHHVKLRRWDECGMRLGQSWISFILRGNLKICNRPRIRANGRNRASAIMNR
jgi:hypothetical protein